VIDGDLDRGIEKRFWDKNESSGDVKIVRWVADNRNLGLQS
jgi:hypothetical protein